MKHIDSLDTSIDLQPGDHLCCLYETDEEQREVLKWFLRQGLERDEKVLFIMDKYFGEAGKGYLLNDGFDVNSYLDSGQLEVHRFDETYTRRRVFHPDKMNDLLGAETEQALAQGYRGLRVTGEMSWALWNLPGSERLVEYEARLNEFFPTSKCIGICHYDRRLFPAKLLLDVLTTHPIAIIGTELFNNFYYMPPKDFLSYDSSVILDHWLLNLKEDTRAREEIRAAYEELRQIFNTATDGMCVIDTNLNILRINATFSTLVGIGKDEAIGKKCYEVFRGTACHTKDCSLTRILSGHQRVEYEGVRERIDGTRIPCSTRAAPIQGPDGELFGIIEDFKDISERKLVEEHIRLLPQKLLKAQEKARQRIARDLHDEIAQDLFTVKIACETLFDNQPEVSLETRHRLLDLTKMVQGSIVVVRNLAYDLRPPSLDQLGLVRTVFQYCQEFSDKTGVTVDFYSAGLDRLRLDSDTEINLYRLIQEGLNNVKKHADANHVTIRLVASSPNIVLSIEDDGKGFDVNDKLSRALREKRLGLQSMQERVRLLDGEVKIRSRVMEGTRISVEIPFWEEKSASKQEHINN